MDIQTLQKLQAMQQQAAAPKPLVGALAGDISLNDMVDSKRTQVCACFFNTKSKFF